MRPTYEVETMSSGYERGGIWCTTHMQVVGRETTDYREDENNAEENHRCIQKDGSEESREFEVVEGG